MTNPNETPDLSPMAQDLIRSEAPDEALEALLAELEETADELRVELNARGRNKASLAADHEAAASETVIEPTEGGDTTVVAAEGTKPARKHKKINPNVTPEQQAELDENFAKYWTNSKGSWKNLFRLLREFRAEMQEGKQNG
ncbi:hypothetical protein [Corynebacterium sp. Marseille-P3884]|uniref:hypothetical protein n=1 Tax=Corynebacterium sp. Marseille-P3884 TaxID=2495409 RepID=UPI001B321CE5|nr:hypothetical protein [Corynebacterium sp. Marseille-P3884]MBP3948625.1 hypothetical protein [Corynebacterium sp. Marseille-P3884]